VIGVRSVRTQKTPLSPNGKLALSAGSDGTVKVWPLSGGPETTFALGGSITTASNDGKLILAATDSGIARVWRFLDRRAVGTMNHGAPIRAAAFNPDATRVVTAGADGVARVWKTTGGTPLEVLHHGGDVTAAAFNPDGSLLATGGTNRLARIWRADDGRLARTLHGHTDTIVALAFSRDGEWLATQASTRLRGIWSVQGHGVTVLKHSKPLTALAFSPDSTRLVTASSNHDAVVWRVRDGYPLETLSGHLAVVSDVAFSFDGRWIVTAGPTTAGLWKASDGKLLLFLHGSGAQLRASRSRRRDGVSSQAARTAPSRPITAGCAEESPN
jgi:WD40 repeat protein